MTWQASSDNDLDQHDDAPSALRAVGVVAGCIGVAALAAAAFILSYSDIRTVARQAGIEPSYARAYPLLIDAMLVIALAAVLALRGAGLPSRLLSWLTLLVVLGAAGGAEYLHATRRTLPHNATATAAAVVPWALVFVAFLLLLAMLRHARLRRRPGRARALAALVEPEPMTPVLSRPSKTALPPPLPVRTPQSWQSVSIVPGFTSRLVSSAAAGAAAGAAIPEVEPPVADGTDQEAIAVEAMEPAPATVTEDGEQPPVTADDRASAEAGADSEADLLARADEIPAVQSAEDDAHTDDGQPQSAEDDARTDDGQSQSAEDDEMPVFHRIWSSPTPPEG